MIPRDLTYSLFKKAIETIDNSGVPHHRTSYRYYLIFEGREYPPKFVISTAYKIKTGSEWHPSQFNAVEAKNYFINKGYVVKVKKSGKVLAEVKLEDEELTFSEGREKYALHKKYERDVNASKIVKEKRLKENGDLKCEVCGFSFLETYGELGSGFIEAHHKIPVSKLGNNGRTRIEDIALVCSNCHKIIHRTKPILSVDKLKKIVKQNKAVI